MNKDVIIQCDVTKGIPLPDKFVHCGITSVPFWGLRDYGYWVITVFGSMDDFQPPRKNRKRWPIRMKWRAWERGGIFSPNKKTWIGALGLEPTPEFYIEHMVAVFRHVWRVLRDDGTLFLNVGDSYNSPGTKMSRYFDGRENNPDEIIASNKTTYKGLKPKDLCMMPARLAIALQADGWYLRSDIIWHKPNPMPESCTDRPTKSHEHIFLLTKKPKYFWDADAVREPQSETSHPRYAKNAAVPPPAKPDSKELARPGYENWRETTPVHILPNGRNKRDVWTIPTQSFPEAHFACVDAQTQILTEKGWKYFTGINYKTRIKIATYDIEGDYIEYQPIKYLKRYDYNGDMVKVGNRDLDILMTPNHRNIVQFRNQRKGVRLADVLKYNDKIMVCAPVVYDSDYSISTDWAALVGWIISEGHYKKGGYIEIYQNEGENAGQIRELLYDAQIPHTENSRTRSGKQNIVWYLKKCAFVDWMYKNVPKKELNRLLVFLPLSDLQCMFNALVAGDGHRRKDDGRVCFVQKSYDCVQWFEVLALHVGYHTTTTPRPRGGYTVFCNKKTAIGIRKTNGKGVSVKKTHYKGVVWCPKTPNGTWIAKRNGRVFITGNTFPEKLVEPCIKAGTSEKGCCPECGSLWVRVVETCIKGRPRNEQGNYAKMNGSDGTCHYLSKTDIHGTRESTTIGWKPSCKCVGDATEELEMGHAPSPCIVFDPFMGSGTVGMVAYKLGRHYIGTELNAEYIKMGEKRIGQEKDKYSLIEA